MTWSTVPIPDDRCACAATWDDGTESMLPYWHLTACELVKGDTLSELVIAVVLSAAWILFLFSMLASTADEYMVPNLERLSHLLNLSPNVAGVTILAFGNGAPEFFTLLAALSSGHGQVAVGSLLGGGMFITTVVLGSVAIIAPFNPYRRPLVRDVGFYLAGVVLLGIVGLDDKVTFAESISMIILYATYIVTVVVGRGVHQRCFKTSKGTLVALSGGLLTGSDSPPMASGGGERVSGTLGVTITDHPCDRGLETCNASTCSDGVHGRASLPPLVAGSLGGCGPDVNQDLPILPMGAETSARASSLCGSSPRERGRSGSAISPYGGSLHQRGRSGFSAATLRALESLVNDTIGTAAASSLTTLEARAAVAPPAVATTATTAAATAATPATSSGVAAVARLKQVLAWLCEFANWEEKGTLARLGYPLELLFILARDLT